MLHSGLRVRHMLSIFLGCHKFPTLNKFSNSDRDSGVWLHLEAVIKFGIYSLPDILLLNELRFYTAQMPKRTQ